VPAVYVGSPKERETHHRLLVWEEINLPGHIRKQHFSHDKEKGVMLVMPTDARELRDIDELPITPCEE